MKQQAREESHQRKGGREADADQKGVPIMVFLLEKELNICAETPKSAAGRHITHPHGSQSAERRMRHQDGTGWVYAPSLTSP